MTTTMVKDSIVGDAWIQQTAAACPIQRVIDPKTGQPTGDILTGPVRLSFDNLFTLPAVTPTRPNPKYGAALLFTPLAKFDILYEDYYKVCGQSFAAHFEPTTRQYVGLHSPFRDQVEKAVKYPGYTPGCVFMTCTSKFKPPVVSPAVNGVFNPIVDPAKVYAGVWAICTVKPYVYGINPPQPKKGVGFGLQTVMIIGDDTRMGGGAPDPNQQFNQARNVQAAIIRPDQLAGFGAQPPAPPPAGIPGYTQPGFAPPAPGGYAPPTMPGQAAPPPPVDPDMDWNR